MSTTMQQAGLFAPPSPSPEPTNSRLFWGYCDPDPKKGSATKMGEAIAAFRARFGVAPASIMTSCVDAPIPGEFDGIPVTGQTFVSKGNFYLERP